MNDYTPEETAKKEIERAYVRGREVLILSMLKDHALDDNFLITAILEYFSDRNP